MILPCRKNSPLHDTSHTMGQMGIRNTQVLFIDAICQNSHLDLLMRYHPIYQGPFLKTQNFILKNDGPLPYDQRHYIAIMVSNPSQYSFRETFLVRAKVVQMIKSVVIYLSYLWGTQDVLDKALEWALTFTHTIVHRLDEEWFGMSLWLKMLKGPVLPRSPKQQISNIMAKQDMESSTTTLSIFSTL